MKKTSRRALIVGAAVLLSTGFVLSYVYFAGQEPATESDKVGASAFGMTLVESRGGTVDLADVIGKSTVVLVFYRGNWWPFCHSQFGDLASVQKEFESRGVTVYGISVESAEQQETMRDDEGLGGAFVFLSDPKGELASKYAGMNGDLHVAATYVVSDGNITYRYVYGNHILRSPVEEVLDAVKKAYGS